MSQKLLKSVVMLFVLTLLLLVSPNALAQSDDIVDVAIADGRFTTLITALQTAELVDTLRGDGPFTVFAPTDQAFSNLPNGVLDTLLDNPDRLSDLLLYHVVSGEVSSDDIAEMSTAESVFGQSLDLAIGADGNVTVNGANVVLADITASNGVIHVIDAVLIPSGNARSTASTAAAMTSDTSSAEPAVRESMVDDSAEIPVNEGAEMPATGGETMPFVLYSIISLLVAGLALIIGGVVLRVRLAHNA